MSHASRPRDRRPGRDPRRDPFGPSPFGPSPYGRPPAGLPTGAALALAVVLLAGGLLGTVALAGTGSASRSVAAGGSPSPVAVATDPGNATASPAPSLPTASPEPAPSGDPGPSPSATPRPDPSPSPVGNGDAIPAGSLQARLDAVRARLKLPGVTAAILWDDGRQWMGASGQRDVTLNQPMTTGTALGLASISKTMTAAIVLQLVDEGRLGLEDRVAPLLPEFGLNPRMTVRNLLDHTSGLPDYFLNGKIDRALVRDPAATWSAMDAWRYEPRKRSAPNRYWIYSNANYLLLGELVERVTGHPLAREVRDRILDPLGLETGWYQAAEEPRADGAVAYRTVVKDGLTRFVPVAPRSDVMPFRSVVTAAGGAGSIAADALDTAKWMRAWAGGDMLSPELQAQVLADIAGTSKLRPRIPYGLGIQAVPIAGRYALGHSGRFLGMRNVVRYLPTEGVTIAVLTNQSVKDPARVATALLKIILPPLPPKRGATPTPKPAP